MTLKMNKYGSLMASAIFSLLNLLFSYKEFEEEVWNQWEVYTVGEVGCTWLFCFVIMFFFTYLVIQSTRVIWYTHSFLEYVFYRISKLDKDDNIN